MTNKTDSDRLGVYASISVSLSAIVSLATAILTPPISGPFCKGRCIDYPYTTILTRFPRDYYWMYPAIIMTVLFVILMVCVHHHASLEKKIFSQIGLSFSIISATALILDYFIQLSVIQPSIAKGESDGISILTQYNPHGLFIALEEIGYLMMSLAFIFIVPAFSKTLKIEKAIRVVLLISGLMTMVAFIFISLFYGINREYRFEVVVITINWTTLIISGILTGKMFMSKDQPYDYN
jgi:hypothetical protein